MQQRSHIPPAESMRRPSPAAAAKASAVPRPGSISFEDRVREARPYDWGFGSTPRTAMLRRNLYWKAAVVKDWLDQGLGVGKMEFRKGIRVDMDRARIVTRAFRETEGQPRVLQYAAMVERLMEEMPLSIKPGELIVGEPNSAPDEVRWYPETNVEWMPAAVTTGGFRDMVTDEERREILEEICPYWKNRSISDLIKMSLPESMRDRITGHGFCVCFIWQEGRLLPAYDYEALFRLGLRKRIEQAEENLRNLDARVETMDPGEFILKKHNWEAMARCGRAILRFAGRYAEHARKLASEEADGRRKEELLDIAAVLDRVPAEPPRTFRECLQFYWIIETAAHYIVRWGNGSGTRIDQIWWPYYEADMDAGRITRQEAIELVECLMLKIQEVGAPLEWPFGFTGGSGAEVFYTSNICGTKPDGSDASNDLSCVIMESLSNLRITQPPIALRYHRNLSPDVLERAIDLCRLGLGHPSFFNEDLMERWALERGWCPEDAKKVQIAGCVCPNIMGKTSSGMGLAEVGGISLVGMLEEVLYDHGRPLDCGPIRMNPSRDPREMESAGELLDAIMDRVYFYTRMSTVAWNVAQQILMQYKVDPCNSFLMDDCLEAGLDMQTVNKQGDDFPNILPFGAMNASDSLAAIQKLIFDERKFTMEELITALQANWEGHEAMRRAFLKAPKFGNDDASADRWALDFHLRMAETMARVRDAWGRTISMDGSVATGYAMYGMASGASPDGRFAAEPLADGTCSPVAGRDRNGPTAVLNSVSKIPFLHPELFNQRMMPEFLEGENRKLFADFLKVWYQNGTNWHIQFNVVSTEDLLDAKKNPEKHSGLIVRVAGYSAHFIDLPEPLQDSIIARTEQSFARSCCR